MAARATSSAGRIAARGSRRAARSREAAETAEAATTRCPAAVERGAEHGAHPAGADNTDDQGVRA